jgi:hypothetical protein
MSGAIRFQVGPILISMLTIIGVPGRPLNAGEPAAPATAQGQWWQYRGDQRLSGRSTLKGHITTPTIEWSYPIAGRNTLVGASLQPGPETIELPGRDGMLPSTARSWDQVRSEWKVAGPGGISWYDLDGDGRLTPMSVSYNQKVGKVLPDQPGLQLIEAEAKGYPQQPNVLKGTVRLKVRKAGQWVTRWEIETDALIWVCEPIFGDFDGDGRNEIALLPWYRLFLLDAGTGKLKTTGRFLAEDGHEIPGLGGRAYGWHGAVDVDRDGRKEFVIIEDFIRYAAVLGWRDGRLQRLWMKVWEPTHTDGEMPDSGETVVVRVNPEPVQDLDGDGVAEIAVSIYNLAKDRRWHVVILDARTGATRCDLPGQFLAGVRDADGDGSPELFATAVASGPRIPAPADLTLFKLKGSKGVPVWTLAGASLVTQPIDDFPAHANTGAALGRETIVCGPVAKGQPPVFFTKRAAPGAPGDVELTCWQSTRDRGIQPRARWTGPHLEPRALRVAEGDEPSVLIETAAFDGAPARLRCDAPAARSTVLATTWVPAPVAPVVVGRPEPGAAPVIVVQGANETVEAIRLDRGKPARLWRIPGRGMTCNNYYEGLLLADLQGDGHLSVVLGTRGAADCARLAVHRLGDGAAQWSHEFPDFPGTPPPWNVPGLMYWQGCLARDPARMDLLVQTRRIGGESTLLDGRDGRAVWHQPRGRKGRDLGRAWMAFYDFDGDRLEDMLCLQPDQFCVVRGTDGTRLVAEESVKSVDYYAYYPDMVVADVLGMGEPQVLYSQDSVTALLSPRGQRLWLLRHAHPDNWRTPAGYGDADGDGRMELFFTGAADGGGHHAFQCRRAADGALCWSLELPDETTTVPVVADLDGDGRDECAFTIGKTLYVVGEAKPGAGPPRRGTILARLDLPDRAGPLSVADLDGSGQARLVVMCGDGRVYGIGPGSPATSAGR